VHTETLEVDAHGLGCRPEDVLLEVSIVDQSAVFPHEYELIDSLSGRVSQQFPRKSTNLAYALGGLALWLVDVSAVLSPFHLQRFFLNVDVAWLQAQHLGDSQTTGSRGNDYQTGALGINDSGVSDRRLGNVLNLMTVFQKAHWEWRAYSSLTSL
jgi:hypothetical protein